jgi:hypothetical protein
MARLPDHDRAQAAEAQGSFTGAHRRAATLPAHARIAARRSPPEGLSPGNPKKGWRDEIGGSGRARREDTSGPTPLPKPYRRAWRKDGKRTPGKWGARVQSPPPPKSGNRPRGVQTVKLAGSIPAALGYVPRSTHSLSRSNTSKPLLTSFVPPAGMITPSGTAEARNGQGEGERKRRKRRHESGTNNRSADSTSAKQSARSRFDHSRRRRSRAGSGKGEEG